MGNFFKNIWSDIKQRKNLELYITLLVLIGVFLADIFGVETEAILIELVLAVLAMLLYTIVDLRRTNESVTEKLGQIITRPIAQNFFKRWDDEPFRQRFKSARKEMCMCAVANHTFVALNLDEISEFLTRGGRIRCVLVDPKTSAINSAAERSGGYDKDPKMLAAQIDLSLKSLGELARQYPNQIETRLMNHYPSAIITMLDASEKSGAMFVTLNGFEQPDYSRPSMVLNKADDGEWFEFYQTSFEHLWSWEKTKPYDLKAGSTK